MFFIGSSKCKEIHRKMKVIGGSRAVGFHTNSQNLSLDSPLYGAQNVRNCLCGYDPAAVQASVTLRTAYVASLTPLQSTPTKPASAIREPLAIAAGVRESPESKTELSATGAALQGHPTDAKAGGLPLGRNCRVLRKPLIKMHFKSTGA